MIVLDERRYKENLKKTILEMAESEMNNAKNKKNIRKYCESNLDRVVEKVLDKMDLESEIIYLKILKKASEKEKPSVIIRFLKSQSVLRSRKQIVDFAKYLDIELKSSYSYNQIIVKVAKNIYLNKNMCSRNYAYYRKDNKDYVLEIDKVKDELIKEYKLKTKNDILSIAKIVGIEIDENENLESIRRKIINHIIKEKLKK